MKRFRDDKIVKCGVVAACVIIVCALFWLIVSNLKGVYEAILGLLGILSPILIGAFFAYLMNPVEKYLRALFLRTLGRTKLKPKRVRSLSRLFSIVLSTLLLLLCIYAIIAMIVPSIISSLEDLLQPERLELYYKTVDEWITNTFKGSELEKWFDTDVDSFLQIVVDTLKKIDLGALFSGLTSSVYSVISGVADFLIGIVAAVYILIYKESLCAQSKKLCVALFKPRVADGFFRLARRTNTVFGHYVLGTIIDMLFVMIVTYIAMLLMGMPYAPLISVIIGVTNIIPFFGPFLGWIPSALLLLVDNPLNALYFSIFILVLQQIEGNIISNRILGGRLGISDLWVLVAILLFGGIFGFAGMLLGVPVFALIYMLISDAVNRRLEKRHYPTLTEEYEKIKRVSDLPPVQPSEQSAE